MTVATLTTTQNCLSFFQQRIVRAVEYWLNHDAVKQLQIAYLDKEKEAILKVISLGLQFEPAWPIVRPLIVALTSFMERRGHWEAWHQLLQRAIAVAQRVGDANGEVTLTALLARLSQRMSRPEDVVHSYRRVIRLARQTGNRFEEARTCSNLGYYYVDNGQWWRSEILSKHALVIFEDLDSAHGQAHTHNHLGALYARQHLWNNAEYHLQRACDLWQSMQDEHSLIHGYGNLGFLYNEMNRSEDALAYLRKALTQAELSGEESYIGTLWLNVGITYVQRDEFTLAQSYINRAEQIFKKFSNSLGLAQVWHNLGIIAWKEKQWNDAKILFKSSIQAYQNLHNNDGIIKVLLSMTECELERKNYFQCRIYLDELSILVEKHYTGHQLHSLRQSLNELHQNILAE
ncbi:MAG: tetratricopeptide repeat protein [Chloroflexota bacterium]